MILLECPVQGILNCARVPSVNWSNLRTYTAWFEVVIVGVIHVCIRPEQLFPLIPSVILVIAIFSVIACLIESGVMWDHAWGAHPRTKPPITGP